MPRTATGRTLREGKYLAFVERGGWEFVTRRGASGVVMIVALTDAREILLVEQFRTPLAANVIELPAGLAGDDDAGADEPLNVAAKRELLEETGYEAGEITWLARGTTSPGLSDEVVDLYLARNLRKVSTGGGEGGESITVHAVPLAEIDGWLARQAQRSALIDLKVYTGVHFARVVNSR